MGIKTLDAFGSAYKTLHGKKVRNPKLYAFSPKYVPILLNFLWIKSIRYVLYVTFIGNLKDLSKIKRER